MSIEKSFSGSYFFSSFFWSTLSRILNAIFGFVSVPLLLGYFGKAEYGLLSIATACNGYMHLMDLGMNTGAIKFFAQWEAEGKRDMVYKVSRTNTSFYLIISVINIIGLLALAFWGENLFSVTHEQFATLRYCFLILALFSCISWVTTVYTQLLTAYKKIAFTQQVQCVLIILRGVLLVSVFLCNLNLIQYFFYMTMVVALAIIPYMVKCKKESLVDTFKPATYWKDFRIVISYSLAVFALSLFQVTATQSRPIVLSIFSEHGAEAVADFNIVQVIPAFIITFCGTFTSIFLPKSSEMIIKSAKSEIQEYVNTWTTRTTILVCVMCFPFIVGAQEILGAYVGPDYSYLGVWLQLWCLFLVLQMHSTPAFSFVLAHGKTKVLVYSTAFACILSICINAALCQLIPVGSAIIGYVVYMLCLIGVYYHYMYKHYLDLDRMPIFTAFLKPTIIAVLCGVIPCLMDLHSAFSSIIKNSRVEYIAEFMVLAIIWLILFMGSLFVTRILRLSDFKR